MAKIRHIASGAEWDTTQVPILSGRVWECGNVRFLDPDGTAYEWDGVPIAPSIPESVTMRQARLVLLGAGLLSTIDAAIAAMPTPQKEAAQIEWEYAVDVRRDSLLVLNLAAALGLTDVQVDALFVAGAAL